MRRSFKVSRVSSSAIKSSLNSVSRLRVLTLWICIAGDLAVLKLDDELAYAMARQNGTGLDWPHTSCRISSARTHHPRVHQHYIASFVGWHNSSFQMLEPMAF